MEKTRAEQINRYKQYVCAICHSKHCQHKIRVKHKDGILTVYCKEYNMKRLTERK